MLLLNGREVKGSLRTYMLLLSMVGEGKGSLRTYMWRNLHPQQQHVCQKLCVYKQERKQQTRERAFKALGEGEGKIFILLLFLQSIIMHNTKYILLVCSTTYIIIHAM